MAAPSIPLPEDLSLKPPGADLAPHFARFHGIWAGSWAGTLPHLLIVEHVGTDGTVQAVYALGDAPDGTIRRQWFRLTGRIEGDELTLETAASGPTVRYRFQDGRLQGEYRRQTITAKARLWRIPSSELAAHLAEIPTYRPLTGETLLIPSHVHSAALGRPLNMVASFFRPQGKAAECPPLLIFNHGSTGNGAISPQLVLRHEIQAQYFLARGFAVLSPMRRGRGASEGEYVEWYNRDPLKLAEGLRHALDDLDAVVRFMCRRSDIDTSRILVAGQSRGGILSIAYAAQHSDAAGGAVIGSINFAGGWVGDPGGIMAEPTAAKDFNRDVFVRAGASTRVPSLWLYAENDSYYGPGAIRRWHDAYTAAGGQSQLYLFPPLEDGDGHLLYQRPALWQSAMDAFLHQLGFVW